MKHPKSYDTTPEVSRRMSRVRLKRGQAETANFFPKLSLP